VNYDDGNHEARKRYGLTSRSAPMRDAFRVLRESIAACFPDDGGEGFTLMPPVIPLEVIEKTDYGKLFPGLFGVVRTQSAANDAQLALTPSVCHHVYPEWQSGVPDLPDIRAVEADCFRFEETTELGRLRSFRMVEYVFLGTPDDCVEWRDRTLINSASLFDRLGLQAEVVSASDPFFGRGGRLLANSQKEEKLKWEFMVHVTRDSKLAVGSSNLHKDHLTRAFEIRAHDGGVLHSTCIGFGLDRLYLAMRHAHGADPERWPVQGPR
jgi:seryl-tRNA synthetase